MSAKEAYKKPEIHLPDLPPEIWLAILREATAECHPLRLPLYMEYPRPTTKMRNRWKQGIVTKRYVIRVCKLWYSLAIPFLYEHLVVSRSHSLKSLVESLSLESPFGLTGVTFGEYTYRLDICFGEEPTTLDFYNVCTLLDKLPKLVVLRNMSADMRSSDDGSRPILKHASSSLECMIWRGIDPTCPSIWEAFVSRHPNLRSTVFPTPTQGISGTGASFLSLPENITTLGTADVLELANFCKQGTPIPNLRHLSFHDHRWYAGPNHGQSFTDESPALEVLGGRLQSLHFYSEHHHIDPVEDLDGILSHCPNLKHLILSIKVWETVGCHERAHGVVTFGVQMIEKQMNAAEAKMFLHKVVDAKRGWLPNLRRVQFIDEWNVTHLQQKHRKVFNRALEQLRELGIVVHSFDERELVPDRDPKAGGRIVGI
ncbi:hypothetical protein CC1G_09173 [Coprinopsis cinerea okayama7|uniref:F-box domain-containing protein n=1 Tax=Coprinopsis cinerea (strain Okayama-7 / 130 / ATCC MYA-4618 / FGSC 9003) TaxID=240176 RepID=A8P9U2_COPC7|nr:hypothetical protein CC1G_09173 [Coprinopsis cinerea okayama7\|eukprot:XP_001839839.1 hypothetical protein CC1G_09173 [Coprinopsis cinerea okayama7\